MGKVRCWRSEDGRKIKEEEVCIDKVKMEGRSKRMRRSLERCTTREERSEDGKKIEEDEEETMGKVRCSDGREIKEEEEEVCIDKVKMEGRSKRMRRSLERCTTREERSEDGRKIKEEAEETKAMKKKKRKRKEVGIIKKVETTTKKKKRKRKEVGIDKVVKQRNKVGSINNKIKKRDEVGIKETTIDVKNGDKFNLSDLLFTKDRDFLIKYNDDQPVKAEHLANKVIVLFFASLVESDTCLMEAQVYLSDIYTELHPQGLLEVVFVALDDDVPLSKKPTHSGRFHNKFSRMPWTAIPFSDPVSRKYLGLRFGIRSRTNTPSAYVFDPTGVVLQRSGFPCFSFGAAAFPFTDEAIEQLVSEYDAVLSKPSLDKLLVSPQRDYLINNKNVRVPVCDLTKKVVALYFYEDGRSNDLTTKLKEAYDELVLKKKKNFEVVLVYISTSWQTCHTTEETFWKTFKTMPWLALPFKDPNVRKLQFIFNYPLELDLDCPDPSLVIIGRRGKFFEIYGADILMNFGCPAYPFTSVRAAELVARKVKKVRLDNFWGPNTVFNRKSGSEEGFIQVQISQLAGKKIIVLFDDDWLNYYPLDMKRLEEMYGQMKGTDDEFEVIQVFHSKRTIVDVPWLTHPCLKKDSDAKKVSCSVLPAGSGLLAFDHEGTVVRRATWPIFEEDTGFPFYNGDVKKEVLTDVRSGYTWDYYSDDDM